MAASASLGLAHYDFAMSATRDVDAAMAESLIRVLAAAPKPALIHCQGGADRSGLAAALYVAAIADGGKEAAERQLSPFFDHVGVPGLIRTWVMDRSLEALEPWLGFAGS